MYGTVEPSNGRKRSLDALEDDGDAGAVAFTREESPDRRERKTSAGGTGSSDPDGWQVVGSKKRRKNDRPRDATKRAKQDDDQTATGAQEVDARRNYPALTHSPHARLQTQVRISDLQALVLYLMSDGAAPQWIAVRHHKDVRKVVAVTVAGLELDMFTAADNGTEVASGCDDPATKSRSPDQYYPRALDSNTCAEHVKDLAAMFPHVWPIKAPGDDRHDRMHSPLQAMLQSHVPRPKDQPKPKGPHFPSYGRDWKNQQVPLTRYIATREQLEDFEYVLHPALLQSDAERVAEVEAREQMKKGEADGWCDTRVGALGHVSAPPAAGGGRGGDLTGGKRVYAMDCEMCLTEGEHYDLTRISLLDWDGEVKMDELVKPERPIVDYLTQYSGMTREKLAHVTTSLGDIQQKLLELLDGDAILVGHSLDSDLAALQMTHPLIVDTAMLYPHPRGRPLKSSLRWLSQKYLERGIQKSGQGHDSIEDARAALDLAKQKCNKGPEWGTSEAGLESIFDRIGRGQSGEGVARTTAIVDWGNPRKGHGSKATYSIGCGSDDDVVAGVQRALAGDEDGSEIRAGGADFVWARLRELEARRGWWNASKTADMDEMRDRARANNPTEAGEVLDLTAEQLPQAVTEAADRIKQIYDSLPPCTAFIVYSGQGGDPRELAQLHDLHARWKKEYNTKRWDQMEVQWTDKEEKAMKAAFYKARNGIGLVTVK